MSDEVDISDLDLAGKITVGEQINWGGYSNISQGTLLLDSIEIVVAIKSLRIQGSNGTQEAKERLQKRFYREVLAALAQTSASERGPIAWARDVIDGLDYLHSITVAHGDLKGENILVDVNGHASLCDFGMSQFLDDASRISGFTTTTANIGGTDRFMAPELLEDEPKTTATDMWAVGCLIVQILTDDIPYQHIAKKQAVFSAIMRGDPPSPNRNNAISQTLWDCIMKCWNKTPEDRPKASDVSSHLAPPVKIAKTESLKTLVQSDMELLLSGFQRPAIKFSPDGKYLAVASIGGRVCIWDVTESSFTGVMAWTLLPSPGWISHLAWSASQRYLLVRSDAFLKVLVVETGETFLDVGDVAWAGFPPDGDAIAISGRKRGRFYIKDLTRPGNVTDMIDLDLEQYHHYDIAFCPDNECLMVLTESHITFHNVKTGKSEATFNVPQENPLTPRSISVSKDGRFILVTALFLQPELWSISTSETNMVDNVSFIRRYKPQSGVLIFDSVQFGGTSDELVLGLMCKKLVHIWDRGTGALICKIWPTQSRETVDVSTTWNPLDPTNAMLVAAIADKSTSAGALQVWKPVSDDSDTKSDGSPMLSTS